MLASKYINLDTIAEVPKENELRNTVSLLVKNKKYISPYSYGFTNNEIITDFFTNSNRTNIAAKGTRPNVNLKLSKTVPGQYYLIKFSDGSVRLSINDVDYTSTPQGDIIGTAEENLQYLILELQGGGGGGVGGSAALAGAGGGAGGYIIAIINLVHDGNNNYRTNSIPLKIGKGGNGSSNRNKAEDGEYTGFYISDSLACIAGQGYGGNGGDGGGSRTSISSGLSFIKTYYIETGGNGKGGYEATEKVAYTSPALAPENESAYISTPYYHTSTGASGTGACSHFGRGGNGVTGTGAQGEAAQGSGAGGGGGALKVFSSTTGGKGGDGLINFYY